MFGDQATNFVIIFHHFLQWAIIRGFKISKNHHKIAIFDVQTRGLAIFKAWAIIKISSVYMGSARQSFIQTCQIYQKIG